MDNGSLRGKVLSSMVWRLLERGGMQIVNFVLQIVLARLLCPEDYGILAIITVFVTFSTTIINNGLANSLIQKKDSDELDYNTVFYTQLALAILLIILLFVIAPFVSDIYDNDSLVLYLRVISVVLILEALSAIQLALLRKNMLFKISFYANVLGTLLSGVTGIGLALLGCGCWSLIFSQIVLKVVIFLTVTIKIHWFPRLLFSWNRLRSLFSYSWKLSVGWMIGTLHQNVFSLVIGKFYSTETLGYYNRAQNLPNTMTTTFNETVSNVMFPALAMIQDDKSQVKLVTRKMMKYTAFFVWPIMAGIAAISKAFVMVMLTEKWAPSIVMMQLFCISFGINILSTTNMQSFNAIGKSEIFMKMEIIKRSISLIVLFITAQFNIYLVIIGLAFMGCFSLFYNVLPNKKFLNYSLREQMEDIIPSLIISLLMFVSVLQINRLCVSYGLIMAIQAISGICIYIILSVVFNRQMVSEILLEVKKVLQKK